MAIGDLCGTPRVSRKISNVIILQNGYILREKRALVRRTQSVENTPLFRRENDGAGTYPAPLRVISIVVTLTLLNELLRLFEA